MRSQGLSAAGVRGPEAAVKPRAGLRRRLFAIALAKGGERHEELVRERKRSLLAGIRGTVLEIGAGTGANFRYTGGPVRWIAVEPNPYMHRYLREEAARRGVTDLEVHAGTAEALDMPDASVDAVVGTLVLCSVADVDAALAEVHRVLRPGGRFLFLEHVAAPPGTWLRRVQGWIRPLWGVLGDGCRPDRDIAAAIRRAGFQQVEMESFRVPLPVVSPHVAGAAVREP